MNVILIGPQGSGKGTQAQLLSTEFHSRHIASGDMFREAFEQKTALGMRAKAYVDRGELVPDEIAVAMVLSSIEEPESSNGVILDGFPRTIAQAQALDKELRQIGRHIDVVVYLSVTHDEMMSRLAQRYICRAHQHVYHAKFRPPKVPGICDIDGSELYQRADDTPEAIKRRLDIFAHETTHVLDYYKQEQKLIEIDADPSVKTVHTALLRRLQDRRV